MEDFHGLRRKEKEIRDVTDKRHALAQMIRQLESDPDKVMDAQVSDAFVA